MLLRRWYLTLTGIALTIGLCVVASAHFPPTYQAKGEVLLLPAAKSVGPGGNPYLELGGLEQATDVLARALMDTTTADALQRQGATGTYTAEQDPTTGSPMVLITAKDKTPSGALRMLNRVIAFTGPTMRKVQVAIAVPHEYLITTKVLTVDSKASPVRKSQIRGLVAAVAIGMLLTVLGVAGFNRLADRRLLRRIQRQLEGPGRLGSSGSDIGTDADRSLSGAGVAPPARVSMRERKAARRRDE